MEGHAPATIRLPLDKGFCAIIDAGDLPLVQRYKWTVTRRKYTNYAWTRMKGKYVYLHRWLAKPRSDLFVDHIDGNGLNCSRSNLRITDHNGNARNSKFRSHNTSGFRGVHLCRCTGRWRAEIRVNGRGIKLGRFSDKVAAAKAYDVAARKYHGKFAIVNFTE